MKQRRLLVLLVAMVALIALRWWVPPRSGGAEDAGLVTAVVRPERAVAGSMPAPATGQKRTEGPDVPGDAFAVRVVRQPLPPPSPPAPRPVKVAVFRGPPTPPPPEPPPPPPPPPALQIVGTWDDAASPGVFIATAQGTVLARAGTVLLAEYRVTAVTPQEVSITHVASKHAWRLPVPRASANP